MLAAGTWLCWSRFEDPYRREMHPVYDVIATGEQGWGDNARRMLEKMIARHADRHALAERLLQESDGSLVAEGMILAVRSQHPAARELVGQHLRDHRWNWYLANNDELAKQLLQHMDGRKSEEWVTALLGPRRD